MFTNNKLLLLGNRLRLELLSTSHKTELYLAAQDPKIWLYTGTKAYGEHFDHWFAKALTALQNEQQLPFVVRRLCDQKIVGSTRFYDINLDHHRLTIGYTWYIPEVWGTYINPEAKYLLLKLAFEELQINRVEFTTDARNHHSQAAILKLGAKQEGTLRQHMVLENGIIRDSVVFSLIKTDWPAVKLGLHARLQENCSVK